MYITDWNQWCTDHHIKLKGSDIHACGRDEKGDLTRICGSDMEAEMPGNGGQTGDRHLSRVSEKRPVRRN